MATAKRAETSQEFYEKYGKLRLTKKNIPRLYLLNYTYWAYCMNDGKPSEFLDKRVFDKSVLAKLNYDTGHYCLYVGICYWLDTAMESAVIIRNALIDYTIEYHNTLVTSITIETLRKELGDRAQDKSIAQSLDLLSYYRICPPKGSPIKPEHLYLDNRKNLRDKIDYYLRYLNVYNTLISLIGEVLEIPELTVFQVDMDKAESNIQFLNQTLEKAKSIQAIQADQNTDLSPIADKAPPIPVGNISELKTHLVYIKENGTVPFSGDSLFKALALEYWRR